MGNGVVNAAYYADFSGLEALKKSAKAEDPKAVRAAARQFESLLTAMMLKTMREARFSESPGDSQETQFYQDMFDQQLAVQLSSGKGMGLADMLVQQLTRSGLVKPATPTQGSAPAPAPLSTPTPMPMPTPRPMQLPPPAPAAEQTRFINRVAPLAERAAHQLGVSADALIAQAALETGWGRHLPSGAAGGPGFNLFGVKGGGAWTGPVASAQTVEYSAGVPHSLAQAFRGYASIEQGVDDYVKLLRSSDRYRQALGSGSDVTAFATGLRRGGYATDPAYVHKLAAVATQVRSLRDAAANADLKLLAGQPTTSGGEPV
ncbi:MAG: flagellar assembly peptidoglycan hydrolase FlgJ [Gammaproteobacteria bacterium]|nr:flagellar assembly peptidoglycan hydrolase FlgJ [Gammaproteobacteria bacterium]